ncbi:hypothetical protein [Salinivibrio phage CW02]|uniref:Uncharacterized protein n=1 Tax=Salinivibrio phage CW02 TaxID=1161935 RepID=H9D1D8_9CAUD|nr:hypothetical protein F490_gp57 [Salinivibrio phage CW02]AFE86180.1 hypothetical protein [Salinivibrio phage CW02]
MKQFKIGQRVVLVNIKDYLSNNEEGNYSRHAPGNTVGNVGTIYTVQGPDHFVVRWDYEEYNDYHTKNLAPLLLEENV